MEKCAHIVHTSQPLLTTHPRTRRAAVADIKLCVLSLDQVFTSSSPDTPVIDPLTLSLIDSHTIILLNKVDSSVPSPAQLGALERALESEGKEWFGRGTSEPFRLVSVKEGRGLAELAEVMRAELKRRCVLPVEALLYRTDVACAGLSSRTTWKKHRSSRRSATGGISRCAAAAPHT